MHTEKVDMGNAPLLREKAAKAWYQDPLTWVCVASLMGLTIYALVSLLVSLIGVDALRLAKGEVWAAWVQAIGTIIALLVAVGLPLWQLKRDRRQRRDEHLARFIEGYAVSGDIAGAWSRLAAVSSPGAVTQPPPSDRQLQDLLDRLRIQTSGMPAAFGANLRTLRRLLHDLEHGWAALKSGSPLAYEDIRRDTEKANELAREMREMASHASLGRRLPATWAEQGEGADYFMNPKSPGFWKRN